MKCVRKILVLTLAACMLLTGCGNTAGQPASSKDTSQVVATVNGEKVHEQTFQDWFMRTMALSLGIDLTQALDESTKSFVESYRLSYLASYTAQRALIQEAQKEKVKVKEEAVDKYVKDLQTSYSEDDAGFEKTLKMMGFTQETIRDYVREQMMIQGLYEKKTAAVAIGATDAEAYYNEHPMEFSFKEQRRVRHILVDTEEEAKTIIADLGKGGDFKTMVAEKSKDTGSKENGGVIGPFDEEANLVPEFIKASFALAKAGDYTKEPVKSTYGYHVIILDEITPPGTKTLADTKDLIEQKLLQQAKDTVFEKYYNELVEGSEIKYTEGFDPYKALDAPKAGTATDETKDTATDETKGTEKDAPGKPE